MKNYQKLDTTKKYNKKTNNLQHNTHNEKTN